MNQRELFDVGKTVSTACPVPGCGAIRLPGQDKVVTCEHDQDLAMGLLLRTRPKGCLNAVDPAHTPWPKGF